MLNGIDWKKLTYFAGRQIFITFCLTATFVLGCRVSAAEPSSPHNVFQFEDGVTFRSDFCGGRLNDCRQTGDGQFVAVLEPENVPINDSAWYAFSIEADAPRQVVVHLRYRHGTHRYAPKIRRDDGTWQSLAADRITAHPRDSSASLLLSIGRKPLTVAAQELITNQEIDRWMDGLASHSQVARETIGHSIEGRPIEKLEIGSPDADNFVLVIGRQHPPEITGQLGLMSFTEALVNDSALADTFRDTFRAIVVPVVNPDGVFHGHWRHNAAGIDLNRDWGPFTQPATCALRDQLQMIAEDDDARLFLFVDFHSTYHDVFYTQSDAAATFPASFTRSWLSGIDQRTPRYEVLREANHGPPTTSKAWVHQHFGVPAITYEFGDNTGRGQIRRLATVAAEEMMRLLLEIDQREAASR